MRIVRHSRALAMKGQCMKLEFIGLKMYQVIAKYLEVDGVPCVVEMISCLDDETLLDAEGREALVKKFAHYRARAVCGCTDEELQPEIF